MELYTIKVKDINKKEVLLNEFSGKLLLIVNIASRSKFTYELEGLQRLYEKYRDKGFFVLAFPSNDFEMEPKSNEDILSFCKVTFGIDFPIFEKNSLKDKENLVYKFLRESISGEIKGDFTKYLVNRKGIVTKRYDPSVLPVEIEKDVEILL